MAKRRHTGEQELPFVALMDTMTNVVGVLTIVLVMIGISLARAANRVFSALPPVTKAQLEAVETSLDRIRTERAPCMEKMKALEKPEITQKQLTSLNTELAKLEKTTNDKGIKKLNIDALKQELAKLEAELKQKKKSMDQLLTEQERLKALLDKTPVTNAPPSKIVRIPASRPIPEGAKIEYILVTKGGVYWLDIDGAKKVFLETFKSPFVQQTVHHTTKNGKQDVPVYDHEKLARYFEKRKLTYHEFRLEPVYRDWTSSPVLRFIPIAPPAVPLHFTLKHLKTNPKSVVMFRITGDGFENYLGARETCDKVGIPAGWEFSGGPEFETHIYEIQTTRPKVIPKPAATTAPQIKQPARKLD